MAEKQEKWMTYAVLIQSAIAEMFKEESENHISMSDFNDDHNLKDFLHALSNVVPTNIYNKLIGEDKSFLEFNHIANQLCFEYSRIKDE